MSVHSPAALARSGACSIQTISSRSLPGTVTARPRLTRSAKRARIITELYPSDAGQQQVAVIEIKEVTRDCLQRKVSMTRLRQKHVRPPTRRASRSCSSRRTISFSLRRPKTMCCRPASEDSLNPQLITLNFSLPRQRTIMLRPLWSDKDSHLLFANGRIDDHDLFRRCGCSKPRWYL